MELATLTTINGMDSRDIAALTGKRHDNVMRDIADQLGQLDGGALKFEASYLTEQNRTMKCYVLPKRECLILASGYNVRLRAAIIDRWIELESIRTPKTFSEALRLCADQADEIERNKLLIESQKPAVAFVESFVEAKQTQPLRAVAKVLGIKERAFVTALINNKILYRLDGRLVPSADVMSRGFFELKEVVAQNGYATTQMRFTTSGVEWIARKVKEWEI